MSNKERKKSGLGHEFSYTPVKEEEYCYEENQLSLNSTNFQVLPGIVSPPFEEIDQRAHQTSHVNNRTDVSQRPPPPKTAFMCFSKAMKGENDLNVSAEQWRLLSSDEKIRWEEEARKDKVRYAQEKMDFVPTADSLPKRRAKKHPLAPKRPMSAFLKYSISRRKVVKADNPDMNNTDISRLLGEMWRNASHYMSIYLGNIYKKDMKRWRLIQQKKETDKALNDSNGGDPEDACSKTSKESERQRRPHKDPFLSRSDKPQPQFTQPSRVWSHGGNDFISDKSITRESITHGRVKSPHHFDNPREPVRDFRHFPAPSYADYGGNDYVGDVRNSYHDNLPREGPSGNYRPQYYYDEARYQQPNNDARVGASVPQFEEKTDNDHYIPDQYYTQNTSEQFSWETRDHQYRY